jgi:hypothetical protein
MLMPEATVNHHDCFVFSEDDIRLAGQISRVEAETKAVTVEKPSHR